jgi:hypothetical protein
MAQQQAQQNQVLEPGQILIDRGELAGQAHPAPHRPGLAQDLVPEHRGAAAVGSQQSRQHAQGRGLAGAVGAQEAMHRSPAHGQIDTVDRAGRSESLGQARCLDR